MKTLKLFPAVLLAELTIFVFSSCGNFLEKPVDNRTLITSLDEIKYTLASLVPQAQHLFTDMMTDDYTFRRIAGHIVQSAAGQLLPIYNFQITKQSLSRVSFLGSGFNPHRSWWHYYYNIHVSWLLLKKIDEYKAKNEEEQAALNSLKGECLAIKAYNNFMLVNLFAKAYNPQTALSDMGPPFVSAYSTQSLEVFPQQTVAFFYDDIEKSLLEAATLVNDDLISNKQLHFTTIVIKAFLSKFYLYKRDWENSIKYATEVIGENSNLVKVKELLERYVQGSTPKLSDYGKAYFDPALQDSYLLVSEKTYQLVSYFFSGMYPEPLKLFIEENGYNQGTFINTSPLFNDIIPMKWLYFTNGAPRLNIMMPLFTVDETYYHRAEASLQKDAPDIAVAKADLALLVRADGYQSTQAKLDTLNALNTKEEVLNFLLKSKRTRFFTEGIRWFDMKRHRLPVSHISDAQTYHIDGQNPQDYVIKPPLEELDFREYIN